MQDSESHQVQLIQESQAANERKDAHLFDGAGDSILIADAETLQISDVTIGRGRLPEGPEPGWATGEPVTLRLEVAGNRVSAFCSLDGERWYTLGRTIFTLDETVRVGVHAVGAINRNIYHGAYPEGSAIRFADLKIWGAPQAEAES